MRIFAACLLLLFISGCRKSRPENLDLSKPKDFFLHLYYLPDEKCIRTSVWSEVVSDSLRKKGKSFIKIHKKIWALAVRDFVDINQAGHPEKVGVEMRNDSLILSAATGNILKIPVAIEQGKLRISGT